MIKWAKILQFNARILASTQAAPVVISMTISVLRRAAKEDEDIKKVLRDLVNGQPESNLKRANSQILSKVTSIVTSSSTWPTRTRHTILEIFNSQEIRNFTKITESYLNRKASEECAQFLSPKTLRRIAIHHEGLWLAKNRTLLHDSSLKRGLINPILRYNRSPLTISLVKYSHYINDKLPPNRPSSCFHTGPKQNQIKF